MGSKFGKKGELIPAPPASIVVEMAMLRGVRIAGGAAVLLIVAAVLYFGPRCSSRSPEPARAESPAALRPTLDPQAGALDGIQRVAEPGEVRAAPSDLEPAAPDRWIEGRVVLPVDAEGILAVAEIEVVTRAENVELVDDLTDPRVEGKFAWVPVQEDGSFRFRL
jgi:hypothetical protein